MTTLLTKVIKKVEQLPKDIQDEIAEQLLEDIENEKKWKKTLVQPQQHLDNLAEETLKLSQQGKTKILGIDQL